MKDWDDIRYFLAVARYGSVTAAAIQLGVNHSTVSRRIQALESHHEVRLFERLQTGYEMTQAAENIFNKAIQLEKNAHEIERELFGQDKRIQGRIVITAPSLLVHDILMPHFTEFTNEYPDIELELLVTSDVKNMSAREADIAIRFTDQPSELLIGRQISPLSQGIYASKKYLNKNKKSHDVIIWNDEVALPDWVENHFPAANVILRADTMTTMTAAVKHGLGIANLPCCIADQETKIYRFDLELPTPKWKVWVLTHADLRSSARIRICRNFLIQALEQHKDLIEGLNSRYIYN